jgi:uncharacterized membrane protein
VNEDAEEFDLLFYEAVIGMVAGTRSVMIRNKEPYLTVLGNVN